MKASIRAIGGRLRVIASTALLVLCFDAAAQSDLADLALDRYRSAVSVDTAAETIDYDMVVFISTGMPPGVLRHLFQQATEEDDPSRVRFVVRGFEPQRLGNLVGQLRRHFPDPATSPVRIEVDPEAFRAYDVQAVPVYLVKDAEADQWFEVRGDISLLGAREAVRTQSNLVLGNMYEIKEPDILEVIEERARTFDWSAAFARAQARAQGSLGPAFDLPRVTLSETVFFLPNHALNQDIVVPATASSSAKVLARRGQVINPLEYMRFDRTVVVIDYTDVEQLDWLERFLREYGRSQYVDLFVVGSEAPSAANVQKLLYERFGRPVYHWFGALTDRFGVRAVPAVVTQDQHRFRIDYVAVR